MDLQGKKLIVTDCDGTLTITRSGETFRRGAHDWQLLPGCVEKMRELDAQGKRLVMATNQGGVGFEYFTEEAILHELQETANQLCISAIYVCFTHPKARLEKYRVENDPRRKPGPGMLLEAMRDFNVSPDETLMVGDRGEDEQAARNAGVDFVHADTFFSREG